MILASPWRSRATRKRQAGTRSGSGITSCGLRRFPCRSPTPGCCCRQCGRLTLGISLGHPAGEFTNFGEQADLRIRGQKVDEALAFLCGPWSGQPSALGHEHAGEQAGECASTGEGNRLAARCTSRMSSYFGAYCASKFGVVGLTQVLARELAQRQIRVNAVCPGGVQTAMSDQTIKEDSARLGLPEAAIRDEYEADVFLGRWASPNEVADACMFLLSASASYVSGHSLVLNGGGNLVLSPLRRAGNGSTRRPDPYVLTDLDLASSSARQSHGRH